MNKTFVFDTNVLLSAAMNPSSASHTAFLVALRTGYIVYSEQTLEELREKIYLPKFDKYAPLSRRENFYYKFEAAAYPTQIIHEIQACRDPKDDQFLELAKSANADPSALRLWFLRTDPRVRGIFMVSFLSRQPRNLDTKWHGLNASDHWPVVFLSWHC